MEARFTKLNTFLLERLPHMVKRVLRSLLFFTKSDDGPTAVEYSVVLALILLACTTSIQTLGCAANIRFQQTKNALQ